MPNLNFDQRFIAAVSNQQKTEYQGAAVTPADATDLPNGVCDAIFATTAGNVSLDLPNVSTADGTVTSRTAIVIPVGANSVLYIRASRVRSTGTTATGIFALYPASNL